MATPSGHPHPSRPRLAAAVLKELARLTELQLGWDHPGALSLAVEDGTFAGHGTLDIDERGNVCLIRIAEDEDHLVKGGRPATAQEMNIASQFCGGSPSNGAVPTSALGGAWLQQFGYRLPIVGTFKVPVRELLSLVRDGKAILGNLGEGEIVLSGDVATRYLTHVQDRRTPEQKLADEASVIHIDF